MNSELMIEKHFHSLRVNNLIDHTLCCSPLLCNDYRFDPCLFNNSGQILMLTSNSIDSQNKL